MGAPGLCPAELEQSGIAPFRPHFAERRARRSGGSVQLNVKRRYGPVCGPFCPCSAQAGERYNRQSGNVGFTTRIGHHQASIQLSVPLLTGRAVATLGAAWRKCGNQDVCCADEKTWRNARCGFQKGPDHLGPGRR